MRRGIVMLMLACLAPLSRAGDAPVKVRIQWDYKDFGPAITLYEPRGTPRLWDTQGVASLKDAPVGPPIEDSMVLVTPGQNKRFVLVLHNPGSKPLHFFAAPHTVHPVEHSLGFKFKCLCIDHAFTVGPGQIWYRVVEFRLSKDFVGRELSLRHAIIGIDKKRADSFSKKPATPDL